MSRLPARRDPDSSRQLTRAVEVQNRTELALFEHRLEARYQAELDRLDSQALGEVITTALDEEFQTLDWGLEQAGGSAAKAELVARMVAMQSTINQARIARRFGGGL